MSLFFPSISDDDEVPPLSARFGDMYPMTGYEQSTIVVPAVNGLHNELNKQGENVDLQPGVGSIYTRARF